MLESCAKPDMVVTMVMEDMEDMDILMLMEKAMVTMLTNAM